MPRFSGNKRNHMKVFFLAMEYCCFFNIAVVCTFLICIITILRGGWDVGCCIGDIATFRQVCRGRIVASRAVYPLVRIAGTAARAAYMPPLQANPILFIIVYGCGRGMPRLYAVPYFYCPVERGDRPEQGRPPKQKPLSSLHLKAVCGGDDQI